MSGMEDFARRHPTPPCPYVTGTVTRFCTLTPFTLTDAERLLIQSAAEEWQEHARHWRDNDARVADESESNAATLRGLLERTR
jgi:hypothetical protein